MPTQGAKNPAPEPVSSAAPAVDVVALFEQLRDEVRRIGPRASSGAGPSTVRLNARAAAERLWGVSADRPPGGRAGVVGMAYRPVKLVLRKLMRWYVEPVFADQRAFNAAILKLVDDIYEELDRLRAASEQPAEP